MIQSNKTTIIIIQLQAAVGGVQAVGWISPKMNLRWSGIKRMRRGGRSRSRKMSGRR